MTQEIIQAKCVTVIVLAWLALMCSCGSGSSPATNASAGGLSIQDVESELQDLPRPLADFAAVIPSKQDHFDNFMYNWQTEVGRRPDIVADSVNLNARNSEARIRWAKGMDEDNVVGLFVLSSWDKRSSGMRGVRVTAEWMLYLDSADNIIGYSCREFPQ